MPRKLSQIECDLSDYAHGKMHNYIRDVVQAFDIADQSKTNALSCIGSQCIRIAAALAVHTDMDRKRWLQMCNEVYGMSLEAKDDNE